MLFRRLFSTIFLSLLATLWFVSCQSPEASAQKLFADHKYQEVIDKFPNTQVARRARAMVAEDLLEAGKFQEVLEKYPDTRAAMLAHDEKAKTLFNERKYAEVLAQFPNSPLAGESERVLAEGLFDQGLLDSLLAKYPKSAKAKEIKETRATAELEAARKMKGEKQITALEHIMRSYTETAAYKDAANLLREVRKK